MYSARVLLKSQTPIAAFIGIQKEKTNEDEFADGKGDVELPESKEPVFSDDNSWWNIMNENIELARARKVKACPSKEYQ